jgi:hypothetical protein
MLEYQLLRPKDSPLFDEAHGRNWTFLVLDEAHQYRGTRGAEMSLLLRRLKQRLRESGNKQSFRCIATSASLAGGDDDRVAVASFASSLFAEPFEAKDVILAETEKTPQRGSRQVPAEAYSELCKAIADNDPIHLKECEGTFDGAGDVNSLSIPVRVGRLLAQDARTSVLREFMAQGPRDVSEVAGRLFPDIAPEKQTEAVVALSGALNRAEQPESNGAFLSVRYHVFLRALEGAFVRYVPEKAISLVPQGSDGEIGASFELALCRECGQHYLVGRQVNGFFAEPIRDPSRDDFGVSFLRPVTGQDEETEDNEPPGPRLNLCVHCTALWLPNKPAPCDHETFIVVEEQARSEQHLDQMRRCATCGYGGQDPVREVIHGGDGPHTVIATTLFEKLGHDRKKILAFADSRQEAAYFAWYLDETYQSVLRRSVIFQSLVAEWKRAGEPLALAELADSYRQRCLSQKLIDEAAGRLEQRRYAWRDVYREFLAEETRLSLSGTGLIRWSVRWPNSLGPPRILSQDPWSLAPNDAQILIFLLLDHLRRDRAVELNTREQVNLDWQSLDLFGSHRICRLGPPHGQNHVTSWNGPRGWRAQFLTKILERKGIDRSRVLDFADKTLRAIWDHLVRFSDTQSNENCLLARVQDGRRLNPIWWRVTPIGVSEPIYRCDTCNRIETSVHGEVSAWPT